MDLSDYNVTSPSVITNKINELNKATLDEIIPIIEKELNKIKTNDGFVISLYKDIGTVTCKEIEWIYKNAGWNFVSCVCKNTQTGMNEYEYITTITLKQ